MAGIYIHIPFCRKPCFYCDFHFSISQKNKDQLLDAINWEIHAKSEFFGKDNFIDTIYFGGGTPSVLSQGEIERILDSVRSAFNVNPIAEVSFEFNPDDLDKTYLQSLYDAGINRLSIGIQSFNDETLKWMNRSHTNNQSLECIKYASEVGFKDITIDLIYGIPHLTNKEWQATVDDALNLPINHISAYSLTLENNTPYNRLVNQKKYKKPNNEGASEQFKLLIAAINKKGWEHYEVSNFCKTGNYSKHNTAYWQHKKYLGVGPSAHSYNLEKRFWNVANNKKYIEMYENKVTWFESESLTRADNINEYLLTGLRTKWGINLDELSTKFNFGFSKSNLTKLSKWAEKGWVKVNKKNIVLTTEGFLFADYISSELFI